MSGEVGNTLLKMRALAEKEGRLDEPIFGPEDPDAMKTHMLASLRCGGLGLLQFKHPHSKITKTWSADVYAGCVENIEDYFTWDDCHWHIDKTELLQRCKEWNEALSKICDGRNYTGEERRKIIELHTASPLTYCGNPSCDKMETGVKEFSRCAKCKKIAYCSVICQREHWKSHKKICILT